VANVDPRLKAPAEGGAQALPKKGVKLRRECEGGRGFGEVRRTSGEGRC
jgi:hypothetical protein